MCILNVFIQTKVQIYSHFMRQTCSCKFELMVWQEANAIALYNFKQLGYWDIFVCYQIHLIDL